MTTWMDARHVVSLGWSDIAHAPLKPGTRARYEQVFDYFSRYAAAVEICSVEDATADLCSRFLDAPLRGGDVVSGATARLRLTVLRSAFDVMSARGVVPTNPATSLRVDHAPRPYEARPLTPSEVMRLLATGRVGPSDTLRPATVSLALAGASHGEIANTVIADLNITKRHIRLGANGHERECALPPSAAHALEARVDDQRRIWRRRSEPWDPADVPLALSRPASTYPVNSVAPTVSGNLSRALRKAGIDRPGLRPKSIREFAANALYAEVGRIEAVAQLLGLRSLDTTARLIDQEWQSRWGLVIRAAAAE